MIQHTFEARRLPRDNGDARHDKAFLPKAKACTGLSFHCD